MRERVHGFSFRPRAEAQRHRKDAGLRQQCARIGHEPGDANVRPRERTHGSRRICACEREIDLGQARRRTIGMIASQSQRAASTFGACA